MMRTPLSVVTPDGFTISGELHTPIEPKALVVLTHGLLVDRHEYLGFYDDVARELSDNGFASVLFDFRGHGSSTGEQTDFNIGGQLIDTIAVTQFAKEHIGNVPLSFVGTSFGAFPAIYAARFFGAQARSVFLLAPVLNYQRTFIQPETEWAQASFTNEAMNALPSRGYVLLDGAFRLSWRLVLEMTVVDPTACLSTLQVPVRIVHGEADSMVPSGLSKVADSLSSAVSLEILAGLDHGFVSSESDTGDDPASVSFRRSIVSRIVEQVKRT